MNFSRIWTQFALEAEYEMFGLDRIAAAHNQVVAQEHQRTTGLVRARETVLRYLSSHQVYDKDARGILERAIAQARGESE